jgi:hypothetical protein
MAAQDNEIERFRLLLAADAKLADAGHSLKRAGLAADDAQIAKLRAGVARALQTLQDDVYEKIPAQ